MRSGIPYEAATSYVGSGINDDLSSTNSSSSSVNSADEFTKLKTERKEQRRNRKLARSISGQVGAMQDNQSGSPIDAETLLLTELAEASHRSMMGSERD